MHKDILLPELEFQKELEKIDKDIHNSTDKDISSILMKKHSSFIYNELGIRVSSLMIYDSLLEEYILYQNDFLDSMGTFYPQISYKLNDNQYSEIVDIALIGERHPKYRSQKKPTFPKYFEKKPEIDHSDRTFMHEFWDTKNRPKKNFSQLNTFYRPTEEVVFFLYGWRYFTRLLSRIESSTRFESFEKFYFYTFSAPQKDDHGWFNKTTGFDFMDLYGEIQNELIQKLANSRTEDEKQSIKDIIERTNKALAKYQNFEFSVKENSNFIDLEWETLGIKLHNDRSKLVFKELLSYSLILAGHSGDSSSSNERKSVRNVFSETIDFINDKEWEKIDKESVHRAIVYVLYCRFNASNGTFQEVFNGFLASVKFPIFAYFLEIFFDEDPEYNFKWHSPKEHLVFPIWYSKDIFNKDSKLKESDKSISRYVAYAIISMEPVWSFTNNFDCFGNDDIQELNILRIKNLFNIINKRLTDKGFYQNIVKKYLLSHATKAAISQVMVRNLSHNIGSHVMNKLVNGNKLEEINISKFHINGENNYQSEISTFSLGSDSNIFNQIAIFNNYVKCKMDYISDVTFGSPLMQTSKSLKGELFKDLDKVRLLLENISGLSHFPFRLNFTNQILDNNEDLKVALPNDILGSQAFYNIIENVIRNTAKHGKNKPHVVVFTVNIKNVEASELNINNPELNLFANDNYVVEIFDNLDISDNISIIDLQNSYINDSILGDSNTLRASGLGLIEMEASACYLRKLDISNIENEKFSVDDNVNIYNHHYNFNILKAFEKKDGNKSYLGYRFFMLKPAEVLIVTDRKIESEINWNNLGVKFIKYNELVNNLESNAVFNHQFLVFDDFKIAPLLSESLTSLPIRNFYYQNVALLAKKKSFEELEFAIWFEWEKILKRDFSYENLHIGNSARYEDNFSGYNAILLDHLDSGSSEKSELENTKDWDEYFNEFYLDAMPSKAQYKLPSFSGNLREYRGKHLEFELSNSNFVNFAKLSESIFTKILVIDERIQESTKLKYLNIPYELLYKKINIIVPNVTEEINLSDKDFDFDFVSKLKDYIENQIKLLNKDHDFILIHYSILERIFDSNSNLINRYLSQISKQTNVVVTSGRGTPENLTKEVRFVNLSPIISSFVEIRSKYLINYLLHSTRKSNRRT